MKPLMYRQRPAIPALMGAVFCLVAGALLYGMMRMRVESGELGGEKLRGLVLLSVASTLVFLIAAFSRYQFTHLWVKPRGHGQRRK